MAIYSEFCEKRSVLFSTDVAARGLDFNKAVDWVVQVSLLYIALFSAFLCASIERNWERLGWGKEEVCFIVGG